MIDAWLARLREPDFGVVLFSGVLSLLMAAHWTPMSVPSLAVVALAVLRPQIAIRPIVWWVMAGLWLAAVISVQERMEDHVYLFTAWLVALAISLSADANDNFIDRAAWHAKVLIGIAFGAAVAWKLYFGDYWRGTTLWLLVIVDGRFEPLGTAAGLSDELARQDRDGLSALLAGTVDSVSLDAPATVVWRIVAAAVLTLALECVIAASHLAPDSSKLAALRLPSIVIFGVTTYAVVPVVPFAALLAVLAVTAARWRQHVMWILPVMILVSVARLAWLSV